MSQENLPYISVIMPVRNEADYIERAIQSILDNDYPNDKLEIIVADGYSTDGTQNVVQKICKQDIRVRLINNPGKIVPTGLNAALREIKGDIFIRIDGHCEIPKQFIRTSVTCLLEHPDAWVAGGWWKTVSTGYVGQTISAATQSPVGVGNARHRLGNYNGWVDTVPYGAHHKWVLNKIGYFDEELVRNQDDEFNMRIHLAGGKIWLSDSIWSTYYARSSMKKLWRQYFQYGFWRTRTMQKHKRPATLRQAVPLLLVSSLLGLFLLGLAFRPLWWLLSIELLLYVCVLAVGALDVGRKSGFKYASAAPLIFVILHFGYGLGGLWGIVRFILLNRWKMRRVDEFKISR